MGKKVRKISEKQIKIIVVIVIVVIVVSILLWGMVPGKIYDVSEILNNPDKFNNKTVNVTGIVEGWTLLANNFTLLDSQNSDLTINVTHTGAFPEGFSNNETVVISGIFSSEETHIGSTSIQIGCPSKY